MRQGKTKVSLTNGGNSNGIRETSRNLASVPRVRGADCMAATPDRSDSPNQRYLIMFVHGVRFPDPTVLTGGSGVVCAGQWYLWGDGLGHGHHGGHCCGGRGQGRTGPFPRGGCMCMQECTSAVL